MKREGRKGKREGAESEGDGERGRVRERRREVKR